MFKNVLVGVDGRPYGRDAIALARRLMDPAGKLTLVFVQGASLIEDLEDPGRLLKEERRAAEVDAELVVAFALNPGRALHEQAEQQDADLLAVGSCEHGLLGRAMLGDDTRAALNGAPCAVAIASRGFAEHPEPIAHVGVAYNDTPESKAALTLARELAAATHGTVHALEVVSIPALGYGGLAGPGIGQMVTAWLEEAGERVKRLPGVEGRAVYGLTGEELAAFGDELDILVVGSRSYGPLRRLVLGSTADYLERHARCSLLVLPRAATADARAASRVVPVA